MAKRHAYRRLSFTAIFRAVAALVLIAQQSKNTHQNKQNKTPKHMECGQDQCDAFAPTPGPDAPVPFLPPLFFVAFFLTFWTLRDSVTQQPGKRLGFRAHAP